MVWKKNIENKIMFKMCFRTHRIQKIYLKINFFFFRIFYYGTCHQISGAILNFFIFHSRIPKFVGTMYNHVINMSKWKKKLKLLIFKNGNLVGHLLNIIFFPLKWIKCFIKILLNESLWFLDVHQKGYFYEIWKKRCSKKAPLVSNCPV